MPQIIVPAALTGGSSSETLEVDGTSLREALDNHAAEHGSDLRDSVVVDDEIKEFVNVYVNGDEVSHLDGLATPLEDDDEIRVVPAASGGRREGARGWSRR